MNVNSLDHKDLKGLEEKIWAIREADESDYASQSQSDTERIPRSFFEGLARVLSSRTEEYIDEFCSSAKQQ